MNTIFLMLGTSYLDKYISESVKCSCQITAFALQIIEMLPTPNEAFHYSFFYLKCHRESCFVISEKN